MTQYSIPYWGWKHIPYPMSGSKRNIVGHPADAGQTGVGGVFIFQGIFFFLLLGTCFPIDPHRSEVQ